MSFLRRPLQLLSRIPLNRLQHTRPKLSISHEVTPIFSNAHLFPDRIALQDKVGAYTYANIFLAAKELSGEITKQVQGKTNQRVMFLCPNDADYVITLWAIWMSGQIAIPLSAQHPKNILLYYANDTNASLFVTTSEHADLMQGVSKNTNARLYVLDQHQKKNSLEKSASTPSDLEGPLPFSAYSGSNALILYTSGTTGSPKGVVLTHKNLVFQVNTLLEAWKWTQNDALLHTLPLHHVHGIVNALLCPLYIGAKTLMLPKFDANAVWTHLLGIRAPPNDQRITVFMAVPTIYTKLIDEYQRLFSEDDDMVEYIHNSIKNKVRLMVSGSAPLPIPTYEKWLKITGHHLLERYGMTEIGMCLSNVYESDREPGYIGLPLPGVSVRLVEAPEGSSNYSTLLECTNQNGELQYKTLKESKEELVGELLTKSDGVFKEYYNRAEATNAEFAGDWFKTGDVASYCPEKKKFRILGRKSADIIKSGGYKISAVVIETALLAHPLIRDCAVVGVEDLEWGERVAAIVMLKKGAELSLEELKLWAGEKLPKYSVPTILKVVESIPKNAMGKVNKKELVKSVFGGK